VAEYSIEIKPSAGKELDAIDHALFARIDRKILALAENPRPPGCKKSSEAIKTNGASAWATGAWCIPLTTTRGA
jgi:mRNA-degrading endonuclease RelE of RelBE toxin-antitoxin system